MSPGPAFRRSRDAVAFRGFRLISPSRRIVRLVEHFSGQRLAPERAAIDPLDEMLLYNLDLLHGDADAAALLYLWKGAQVASSILRVAGGAFGQPERARSVLDFASGYGRSTRFLVTALDPRRLWVADIVEPAVASQVERFGVHGLRSAESAADFEPGRAFDLIFVSSLFSHLPEAAFGSWLDRLASLLAPRGVLALSTLDAGDGAGHTFHAASESRELEPERYGTAYVTEAFVRRSVAEARCSPSTL